MPGISLVTRRLRRLAGPLFVLAAIARPASAQPTPRHWVFHGSAVADFAFARDTTVGHSARASLRVSAAAEPSSFAA